MSDYNNWYAFAERSDIRAHKLYRELIEAKAYGTDWSDTWVKVKHRDAVHIDKERDVEHDWLWNGFQWTPCFAYETNGRLYVRLPLYGEVE